MKKPFNSKALFFVFSLILVAAFTRLIPHWPNFTAVGAIALFGSAVLKRKFLAFFVPLVTLWFSDLIINNYIYSTESFVWFQPYQLYTLIPMAFIVLMGIFLFKNTFNASKIVGASTASALIFFLVSNFGAWLVPSSNYSNSFLGLIECYIAGLPFLLYDLAGTLFYSSIIFSVYYVVGLNFPSFKLATEKAK